MKTHQIVLPLACILSVVAPATSQIVDSVIVSKVIAYEKTSSGAPGPSSNPFGNSEFSFDVSGSNLAGISAPTVTLPAGSTFAGTSTHNGGVLVYNSENESWQYGVNGNDIAAPSGLINTYFASGLYTATVKGTTVSLTLGNILASEIFRPDVTFSQGTWSGGKLVVDPTKPLTITTSVSAFYHGASGGIGGVVDLELSDVFSVVNFSRVAPVGVTLNESGDFASYTIAANSLAVGTDYFGSVEFDTIVDQSFALPGSFNISGYGDRTNFLITAVSAVPEPSSYAAIAGLFMVGLVGFRRSRSRMKV